MHQRLELDRALHENEEFEREVELEDRTAAIQLENVQRMPEEEQAKNKDATAEHHKIYSPRPGVRHWYCEEDGFLL